MENFKSNELSRLDLILGGTEPNNVNNIGSVGIISEDNDLKTAL